jgi:nitrogenase-associated protein
MTDVIFYEKPGCANNARQKRILERAGHRLEVHSLLETHWSGENLRSYFGARPVAEWFNKAAPRIKSGEIDPSALGADAALALLVADPILIRRPLIEALGTRVVGFDQAALDAWIGLAEGGAADRDLESCRRAPPMRAPAADKSAGPERASS